VRYVSIHGASDTDAVVGCAETSLVRLCDGKINLKLLGVGTCATFSEKLVVSIVDCLSSVFCRSE